MNVANVLNPNDIIIGTGKLYIDGVDVGQLEGEVQFTHGKNYYEKQAGFPATTILKIIQEETCIANVSLLEANLSRLRSLMDEYAEYTATTGSASVTAEEVAVNASKNTKLSHEFLTGTITVTDALDNPLAEGTDYYLDRLDGQICRVSGSVNIDDGDTVKVSYDYVTHAESGFGFGGAGSESTEHQLVFVHKKRDGTYRVVKIWKAKVGGDFVLGFNDADVSPIELEISAVADSTKAAGQQFGLVYETETPPFGGW
jgi:hypothetical protein